MDHMHRAMIVGCGLWWAVLASGAGPRPADLKWSEVRGVRIPIPPAEHPRLYLRARDLDDLKRRTTHPVLQPVWERLQHEAKGKAQTRVEVDAVRYLLTRDPELGKATIQLALETLEHSSFDLSKQDITRPIGRMMVTGAIVYDWCYPLLTSEQKKRFLDAVPAPRQATGVRLSAARGRLGHRPRLRVDDHARHAVGRHRHLRRVSRRCTSSPRNRFFSQHLPARNWWYPGHAFHQGSAYAETRFVSDMYPLWIFDRLGAGNVYNPEQRYVPYQWIYMRRPDGQLLRSGDGQFKSPQLRSLLCASYYGDGYVLADYSEVPRHGARPDLRVPLGAIRTCSRAPSKSCRSLATWASPFGWMVARTGWGADSVIAEMKVNVYNFTNHQHLDAGAFQIYYKGAAGHRFRPLRRHRRRLRQPASLQLRQAHHRPQFATDLRSGRKVRATFRNDGGQRLPNDWHEPRSLDVLLNPANGYKTGTVLGHIETPEYSWLAGDITAAYSAKAREVKRAFVFLNLGPDTTGRRPVATLIVFDKVVSSNAGFRKYWLLHSVEEPSIQGNSFTVSRGDGKLVDTVLLPPPRNTDLSKIGGLGKEFWVFGENFPNQPKHDAAATYEPGAWRVELSPNSPPRPIISST